MALSLTNENLETYCLIWLDAYVNHSHENRQAQQQLRTIINHVLTFENDQQFIQYITSLSKDDRIVLIISGSFGRQIVPQIANLQQISSIYVYCFDKRANEQWSRQFFKVKGVITRLNELIQRIHIDYMQIQSMKLDESLSIQISNNEQFLQTQLLLDCLIRLNVSTMNAKNALISFCKQYYQNNQAQLMVINEFERDYSSEQVLVWFTRPSFLCRLLTKAIRERNIDVLYRFQFLLHDIGYQLGKTRCSSAVRVYRSQLMTREELDLLKTTSGQMISINSFLTASFNRDQTRSLLHSIAQPTNDIERVLFEIDADPHLPNTRPFGKIPSDNNEVFFMAGSIFRTNRIERDHDQISIIQLSLCSLNDQQHMKAQLGSGKTDLLRFGHLLSQIGKSIQAEKYYRRYLNQLPNDHPDISNCCYRLGTIAELKKDFPSSVKWYQRSLGIQESETTDTADMYSRIANIYFKANGYKHAVKAYKKSLKIYEKTLDEKHPRIGKCLNDLGGVYEMKKMYSEALDCYTKAAKIFKQSGPPKHLDIGMTKQNIAHIYELQCDYAKALHYYRKALKVYRHFLPETQPIVDDIEKVIQRISLKGE